MVLQVIWGCARYENSMSDSESQQKTQTQSMSPQVLTEKMKHANARVLRVWQEHERSQAEFINELQKI